MVIECPNLIENSDKTTIALTTGLALGGGLELALTCDYRIGTKKTQFRFPETSIGIYPGLSVVLKDRLEWLAYHVQGGQF